MNLLDIKNFKVPKKQFKIKLFDEEINVDIYPICGFGLAKLQKLSEDLSKDQNNTDIQEQLIRITVKNGTKCDDQTVNFIIDNDMFAAMELTQVILEYSSEYNNKKMEQSKFAKKNLKK